LGLADVCGIIIDPPYGHSTPHALAGFFLRIRSPSASSENLLLPTLSTPSSTRISLLY
jgi:hypothetical protein